MIDIKNLKVGDQVGYVGISGQAAIPYEKGNVVVIWMTEIEIIWDADAGGIRLSGLKSFWAQSECHKLVLLTVRSNDSKNPDECPCGIHPSRCDYHSG